MAKSATVMGFAGKVYRNTGTYGSPTWVECSSIKDFKLPLAKDMGDVSARLHGGWKVSAGALKGVSIDFTAAWRKVSNALPADVQAFLDAWVDGDLIELMILDGEDDATGAEGIRASFEVSKFERDEPINGSMVANISIELGDAANNPTYTQVA